MKTSSRSRRRTRLARLIQGKSAHTPAALAERLEPRRLLSLVVPALNSRPSAPVNLFLDFDGSPAFDWGGTRAHGPGSNDAPIPAFSSGGGDDVAAIIGIFSIVEEKFSPFNINVTTIDPGNRTHGVTLTDIIGGSNSDWYGKSGGVSQIGSFTNTNLVNTVFDWTGDLPWSTNRTFAIDFAGGNTIPHEAGHAFGLSHERTPGAPGQPLNEYYDGDSTRSPIMGNSANGGNQNKRGIWWQTNMEGGQNSPDPIQDELSIISSSNNGFGYRADDWSYSNFFTLTPALDGSLGPVNGVIENTADVDPFKFTAIGTSGTFKITSTLTATGGGMLKPSGRLVDATTLSPIPFNIVVNGTTATLSSSSLVAGHNYYIEARSFGGYGDLGQYFVSGNLQGFASYNSTSREVSVHGFGGNNNVTLTVSYNGSLSQLVVQDSLNGGSTVTQTFMLSAVDSVSVDLGGGDDTMNWTGLFKLDGVTQLPVYADMGDGFDTMKLGGGSTFETFNVGLFFIDLNYAGVRTSTVWYSTDAERIEMHGNNGGGDTFNINEQNGISNFYAYGVAGTNRCVLSPDVVSSPLPVDFFYGGTGVDTLELDGSTLGFSQDFTLLDGHLQRFLPGNPFAAETQFDSAVNTINIKGGSGNDTFEALSLLGGQQLNLFGNGGDDTFRIGLNQPIFPYTFTANILGTISAVGGPGNDLLYVDDVASVGFFNGFTISSTSFSNNNTTGRITFDSTLDQLEFHASNHGSQVVTVIGIPAMTALNLVAGTGAGDTLIVNDRTLAVAPFRMDVGPDYYKECYGTSQNPTIRQMQTSGFESFQATAHNNTSAIYVYGLSPAQSTQITPGANTAAVTLYPHDAAGNLTINGDVTVYGGGGSSKLIIDDTGQASPVDYVFSTLLGLIDKINGLGTGNVGLGFDLQNVVIYAGDGDDTFDFNQHKTSTGVAIYAGGGNNVLNFGAGNLPANATSASSFLFDGQSGYNTLNLLNAANTDSWTYNLNASSIVASRTPPAASYDLTLNVANTQHLALLCGSGQDVLNVLGLNAGQTLDFNSAAGLGALNMPTNPKFIAGHINFNGAGGTGNRINELVNSDTTDSILHVTSNSIGALPGDTFFAPGGSIGFDSLAAVQLKMGSGNDTAYITPSATATISINGGSPNGAPGDTLVLALANALNYFTNGTSVSGNVTSDNLQTASYSGFETGPIIDDSSPIVLAWMFNDGDAVPAGLHAAISPADATGVPTLVATLSEQLVGDTASTYLQLLDLVSGTSVSAPLTETGYDPMAGTETFTFGNGLPAGIYRALLPGGSLFDSAGNPLAGESYYDFLYVPDDGALALPSGAGAYMVQQLSIGSGGALDLADNDLIVRDGDVSAIAALLQSGFNAGTGYWNGSAGIVSTSAAGDSTFLRTIGTRLSSGETFDGFPTNPADVLIHYTYYGDADLIGGIDGADYQQIDNGFGTGATDWSNGDFNYDGAVDGLDYSLIDNAFNQQAVNLAPAATSAARLATPQLQVGFPEGQRPTYIDPASLQDDVLTRIYA